MSRAVLRCGDGQGLDRAARTLLARDAWLYLKQWQLKGRGYVYKSAVENGGVKTLLEMNRRCAHRPKPCRGVRPKLPEP